MILTGCHVFVYVCLCVCSYYRFVLEPELEFTEDTGAVSGPFAQFDGLPLKPLLTVGMDPPESWLVESVEAVYDLDNICMDEVTSAVVLWHLVTSAVL